MAIKISKATERDKREALSASVAGIVKDGRDIYRYLSDYDDSYVYYTEEVYDDGYSTRELRREYSYDGATATLGEEATLVVRQTEYKEVTEPEILEKALSQEDVGMFKKFINFLAGEKAQTVVIKQFDDESMVAIEPLYIEPEGVDLAGDTISKEETAAMVDSLNKAIQEGSLQYGLFHKHKTDSFVIEKAWVNEAECTIGGKVVPEGKPLVKTRFKNQAALQARKDQELGALSIGARAAEVEILDE